MRTAVLMILVLGIVTGGVAGQPKDGDLILSGVLTTLVVSVPPTGGYPTILFASQFLKGDPSRWWGWTVDGVRMDSGNRDLIVAVSEYYYSFQWNISQHYYRGHIVRVDPVTGSGTTILTNSIGWHQSLDLDHDDTWAVCGNTYDYFGMMQPNPYRFASWVAGVRPGGQTFYVYQLSKAAPFPNPPASYWVQTSDMLIDCDPGSPPYVVGFFDNKSAQGSLCRVGSNGVQCTIVNGLSWVNALELEPATGNYLVCESKSTSILKKDGSTLATIPGTGGAAAKVNQDGTAWVVTCPGVALIDLARSTITTLVQTPAAYGIEVYGSRRIVCNGTGKPGTSVMVNVQSRKAGDGGKSYALACSFNRRPPAPAQCLQFPNGEYLFLDYTDNLFWTSFMGWAPSVFQNFKGVLDSKGNATAQVNIPSTLPPNLGITVFVAGVIYDATGVRTVTNTHWFVLP